MKRLPCVVCSKQVGMWQRDSKIAKVPSLSPGQLALMRKHDKGKKTCTSCSWGLSVLLCYVVISKKMEIKDFKKYKYALIVYEKKTKAWNNPQ